MATKSTAAKKTAAPAKKAPAKKAALKPAEEVPAYAAPAKPPVCSYDDGNPATARGLGNALVCEEHAEEARAAGYHVNEL